MRILSCVPILATVVVAGTFVLPACTTTDEGDTMLLVTAGQCDAATAWSPLTPYAMGAVVSHGNAHYVCLQSHASQPGWQPNVVPALWGPAECVGGGGGGGGDAGGGDAGGGDGTDCDATAWVYMGNDPWACRGRLGESCGWTTGNLDQGYHCQTASWGAACMPGGDACSGGEPGGGDSGGGEPGGGGGEPGGDGDGGGGEPGTAPDGLVFSAYKDTSINMDWNTNVASSMVSGTRTPLAADMTAHGAKAVTLAFATGNCGSENWGGVPGDAMAAANRPRLTAAGIDYIISTGGAAGSFRCASDAGMFTFIDRWASPNLIGVDFDIEAGQSHEDIRQLVQRIQSAHARYPGLRFSVTIATLANNNGATTAQSLGAGLASSLNGHGVATMQALRDIIGSWPRYVTVNLMTMDYGAAGPGVCVVNGGVCDMGQSAIQAAYNLRDQWGVPFANIELTPMIGGNDVTSQHFTLTDVDTMSRFAISHNLAGVHYWSYDRDRDCPKGPASPTCNSLGTAGNYGFLRRFLDNGLN